METPNLDLEAVPVRVVNVNFDGLGRTKGDFVAPTVKDLFNAKTFGELIARIGQAQERLRRLETFSEVGAIIDVSNTMPSDFLAGDGYDVTFVVHEFGRFKGNVRTQMGMQADAQVKTGVRMPNLFGRGEKLEVEYSYSPGEERNIEMSFTKPVTPLLDSSMKTSLFHTKSPNVLANYLNTAVGSILTYCFGSRLGMYSVNHKFEWEATWREITPASMNTPFSIRLECGNSFKSAIRHVLTLDGRDRQLFPTGGSYANFLQELAGVGGDVKYHKIDIDLQHNIPLPFRTVFQTSFRVGALTPLDKAERSCGISDKFFLGGPYSLRGFTLRGVRAGVDGLSLGGTAYWSAAAHLYTPLPSVNRKFPMVDNCRIHFFVNAGNLADKMLAREILQDIRVAYGAGIAVGLGDMARLEANYCWPIKHASGDKAVKGLQLGVGIQFL